MASERASRTSGTKPTDMVTLRMTRKQAMYYGLLICECGYPQNNHFDGTGPCAHNSECKAYTERARTGMEVVTPSESTRIEPKWVEVTDRFPAVGGAYLARLEGWKEHSGLMWSRPMVGWMLRGLWDTDDRTIEGGWSGADYDQLLKRHGADGGRVTHILYPIPQFKDERAER